MPSMRRPRLTPANSISKINRTCNSTNINNSSSTNNSNKYNYNNSSNSSCIIS